jgi:hypothetical protein
LLESHHGYIQWLFPNAIIGVNPHAPTITNQDIEFIRHSSEIQNRFLSCFDLMLDFYGFERQSNQIHLKNEWKSRIKNLHDNTHNFLRITRILIALNLFGFGELQFPFLQSLLKLVYFENQPLRNAKGTSVCYWLKTMREEDQEKMNSYLKENEFLQNQFLKDNGGKGNGTNRGLFEMSNYTHENGMSRNHLISSESIELNDNSHKNLKYCLNLPLTFFIGVIIIIVVIAVIGGIVILK